MNTQIRGVAFDLEGTLVNVEPIHFTCWSMAVSEAGMPLTGEDLIRNIPNAIGGGDDLIARGIHMLSGERISAGEILTRKDELYEEAIKKLAILPRAGVIKTIRWLKKKKIPIAIGSLTPTHRAHTLLDRSQLRQYFSRERIVLKEDVGQLKPEPDVYIETAHRIGIKTTNQLVFEDSVPGIQAARSAGSHSIAMPIFRSEEKLAQIVLAGAHRVFHEWTEMHIEEVLKNLGGRAK